ELFDALPVHRLGGRGGGGLVQLWGGGGGGGGFLWRERDLSDPALADLLRNPEVALPPGQVADLAPAWGALYGELARRLGRGLPVPRGYGFERCALLRPA